MGVATDVLFAWAWVVGTARCTDAGVLCEAPGVATERGAAKVT